MYGLAKWIIIAALRIFSYETFKVVKMEMEKTESKMIFRQNMSQILFMPFEFSEQNLYIFLTFGTYFILASSWLR